MGEMPDIDVKGLVKRYGDVVAVDGLTFAVQKGEVFGMLGPNGAGKTTTLEIIEGLRTPDAGTVQVLGTDVIAHPSTVKERIGVQLQATALPPFTKVREAVQLFAALYQRSRPVEEVIEEFNLGEKADAYTDKLSGGQMQRLSIALALINDPDLVFLDEPTTGLDPQARLNIWTVIEGIRKRGKTVVLTTHYMEEAERLCDRVAVIERGRIVALDTPVRSRDHCRVCQRSRSRRREPAQGARCGACGGGRAGEHHHAEARDRAPRPARPQRPVGSRGGCRR
jgi:ABC-2 type transport system ATP-binding protein